MRCQMTCLLHEIGMGKEGGYAISQKQQSGRREQVRSDGVREGKGQCKVGPVKSEMNIYPHTWPQPLYHNNLNLEIKRLVLPAQVGCMRQVLGPGALGRPREIGWRGRWEGGSGWGIHVTPWLIHVSV